MKVLFFFTGRRELMEPEPLNLEALAGMIPDCDSQIIDLRFEDRPVRDIVEGFAPHIVAVTANTIGVYQALDVLRIAKEVDKSIFTVVGGSHPSSWPQDFDQSTVNAVVIGMGEEPFKEIVEALDSKNSINNIKGLAVPGENGMQMTGAREVRKNLDTYPFPRRDLTRKYRHRYRYIIGKSPMAMISTARGCPNRCSFCAIWRLMTGKYITRSPESVVAELATIDEPVVRFADGNTFGHIKRVHDLCDRIVEAKLNKRIMMDISTNIVVKQTDLIEKLRAAGVFAVVLGIESIDDARLDEIRKNCTASEHDEAIDILHKNGIAIAGNFLIEPGFGPEDFDRVEEYIIRKEIELPVVNITTPLPGTLLFDEKKDEIITDNYNYFDLRHLVLPTKMKRKAWWRRYQKLNRKCLDMAFQRFSGLKPWLYKPALALSSWQHRKDHLLAKPGRPGTYLHGIVSSRNE